MSKRFFSVMMDPGAFTYPVIGLLFKGAKFIPAGPGEEPIAAAIAQTRSGVPFMMSLKPGGYALGKHERPRSGAIRIAIGAKADLIPLWLQIEPGKRKITRFSGVDGESYEFSVFNNTRYFAKVLEPVTYEALPADGDREAIRALACDIEARFDAENAALKERLAAVNPSAPPPRRRGGARGGFRW